MNGAPAPVVTSAGVLIDGLKHLGVRKVSRRSRLVDPFIPFLKETLEKHPRLRASRLWSMAKARG